LATGAAKKEKILPGAAQECGEWATAERRTAVLGAIAGSAMRGMRCLAKDARGSKCHGKSLSDMIAAVRVKDVTA
jgi:hypothetical protein